MNFMLRASAVRAGELFGRFFASSVTAFSSFSWSDALDIAVMALILFFLFRFVIHRKSAPLLIGLGVVLVLYVLAYILDLNATEAVLSYIFRIGGVFLIVLFQPELREALERIGTGAMNGISHIGERRVKQKEYHDALDNLCSAVGDLSKTRTGALIVLVRTTKLDDVIQTGVLLDANVSSFLLRNLFFNKAPLHDGAVIIDGARIVAAGCLLPLTRRSDVDANLGTRHRAAIGMSEVSDALIVVVSEETGNISVAYDCALTRGYTPQSLKSFLAKKLLKGENPGA